MSEQYKSYLKQTITALRAQVEALAKEREEWKQQAQANHEGMIAIQRERLASEQRCAEIEKAARPFAELYIGVSMSDAAPAAYTVIGDKKDHKTFITAGEVRTLRALIEPTKGADNARVVDVWKERAEKAELKTQNAWQNFVDATEERLDCESRNTILAATIERLAEALEPFAAAQIQWEEDYKDDDIFDTQSLTNWLKVKDLRRARVAVEEAKRALNQGGDDAKS